ncbi:MAG: hypothetical protein V3U87_05690 [Methylococcaceae bacterium]
MNLITPIAKTAKNMEVNVNTLQIWIGKYSKPKVKVTARTDEHIYDEIKRLKEFLIKSNYF